MPSSDLLAAFKQGLAQAKKERKSDDIIDFIRANWSMFSPSKSRMGIIIEELEQQGDLTVQALSDALDLPQSIVFKKVKITDTAKLLLNIKKSSLYTLFNSVLEKRSQPGSAEPELCLLAVAGEHTMVITNMRTEKVSGCVHLSLPEDGREEINVFKYRDAQLRMPSLFNKKE